MPCRDSARPCLWLGHPRLRRLGRCQLVSGTRGQGWAGRARADAGQSVRRARLPLDQKLTATLDVPLIPDRLGLVHFLVSEHHPAALGSADALQVGALDEASIAEVTPARGVESQR